jgi:hypothetical protein
MWQFSIKTRLEIPSPNALAADVLDLQVQEPTVLGVSQLDRTGEFAGPESAGDQGRVGHRQRQSANRHIADGLALLAADPQDRLDGRSDRRHLGHVLTGQRPVDNPTGRAVQIPLPRLRQSLADVPDDVLLDAKSPRRMPGRVRERQHMVLGVVAGDAHHRLVPHVIDRDLGVPHIKP